MDMYALPETVQCSSVFVFCDISVMEIDILTYHDYIIIIIIIFSLFNFLYNLLFFKFLN